MLAIRLFRKGKKNQPFFKIVVTEKEKSSTRGRFVEEVGFYNPLTKERSLKGDRIKYWMSVGAKPSDTVYNMLVKENIVEGKKIPKQKKSKKKQEEPAATQPVAEAPATPPVKSATEEPKEEAKTEEVATEQPKEPANAKAIADKEPKQEQPAP